MRGRVLMGVSGVRNGMSPSQSHEGILVVNELESYLVWRLERKNRWGMAEQLRKVSWVETFGGGGW